MRARIVEDDRRRLVEDACMSPCAIERGMRIIGGKWTGSILWHLKDGPVRFNDLARMIGGASKKMITERLRQLEAQGLVTRKAWTRPRSRSTTRSRRLAGRPLVSWVNCASGAKDCRGILANRARLPVPEPRWR